MVDKSRPSPSDRPAARPQRRGPASGWLAAGLLAVGVVLGVLLGAVFGPLLHRDRAPTYSREQIADAKVTVCAAYTKVRQGVLLNTGRNIGDDPASLYAVAANARMALFDGGEYLLGKLHETPATAADLAAAARSLVDAYQQLAIDYLAEVPDEEEQSSTDAVDAATAKIADLCQ